MKNVQTYTALLALAIGSFLAGQVVADGPDPNLVDQRPVYDIGIVPVDGEVTNVATPEGKADTLVVLTATWCGPCQMMKPGILALKAQGYKVEYFDIDHDLEKLAEKYSNIKRVANSEAVNHWDAVPTMFFVRGDMIIKKHVGLTTTVKIKETLWKPSDSEEVTPVDKIRRKFPWNR